MMYLVTFTLENLFSIAIKKVVLYALYLVVVGYIPVPCWFQTDRLTDTRGKIRVGPPYADPGKTVPGRSHTWNSRIWWDSAEAELRWHWLLRQRFESTGLSATA